MPIVGHKIETTSDNFGNLVRKNCLLVDKTLMIKEFIQELEVFLILRPRRSGKSLAMSMLQHFFASHVAGEATKGLFDHFLIAKEDNGEFLNMHQGQYPVISITLKDIKAPTYDEAMTQMESLIQKLYREHQALLTADCPKITKEDKSVFQAYLNGTMRDKLQSALSFLSDFLFKAYGKKTIILIDEYDAPLTSAYQERLNDTNFLHRMSLFMRDMFSEALKTTTSLEKGCMTGILRISKNDMLSGLNNPEAYTLLDSNYARYFGFTETEVEELMTYTAITEVSLDAMKDYYNGYNIGGLQIYNPWSTMKFLHRKDLAPYWVLSASDQLLKELFLKSDDDTKEKLSDLMQGKTITGKISLKLRYEELMTEPNALWTLLLFSGYLTVESKRYEDDVYACQLKIPNREVLAQYKSIFKHGLAIKLGGETHYDSFLKHLLQGNVEKFTHLLENYLLNSLSVRDVMGETKAENFYHGFFAGLVASIQNTHELRSNQESGYGIYDILIKPKTADYSLGIVLEFKHVKKNQSLKKLATQALEQIHQQAYNTELKQCPHVKQILNVGLAFRDKSVIAAYQMENVK